MDWIKRLFTRQHDAADSQPPRPLRIEGCKTTLTPEPDDAELAAQALLELCISLNPSPKGKGRKTAGTPPFREGDGGKAHRQAVKDAAYYKKLAERIRQAHDEARIRALRFIAYCEQQLQKKYLPMNGPGSLGLIEAELYKRIDIAEREGGDLHRRWQHCLAEVIVRQFNASHTEDTERTEGTENTTKKT